ncbi:hypothetical protein NC653_035402 [Populus alba x Populus x berolinensis]|uniref:Uncharacterized protein n=1 Tax=Populus alba x Populus x berolinensis TaxID=444605 RepID=A0AAD6LQ88_9ROSI|nr:hypothetical protein NC653_035402 [Populus alba x Populus x berolinensis]
MLTGILVDTTVVTSSLIPSSFLDMKLLLWMKLSTSRIHLMISTKPGRLGACSINCLMDMTSTMC